jgi:hypothetical protein
MRVQDGVERAQITIQTPLLGDARASKKDEILVDARVRRENSVGPEPLGESVCGSPDRDEQQRCINEDDECPRSWGGIPG